MPVGVPKVPFRIPGDEDATWVDIYNRLYRQRVLFLCEEVDYEISNNLVGLMVFLTMEDKTQELFLLINSPGGLAIPGMAIFDIMQSLPSEFNTICIGIAASMATYILVGGEITKRVAFPHARVMIHQPATSKYETKVGESILDVDELKILRENITKVFLQRTRTPLSVLNNDMERDSFMSATQAKEYGIIDEIGVG